MLEGRLTRGLNSYLEPAMTLSAEQELDGVRTDWIASWYLCFYSIFFKLNLDKFQMTKLHLLLSIYVCLLSRTVDNFV